MKKLDNIAMGPDGLPQFWKSWTPLMKEAWFIGENDRFKAATGLDLRASVGKAVRAARVRLAAKQTVNNPAFQFDLDRRLRAIMALYLGRNFGRKFGRPIPTPIRTLTPSERQAIERKLRSL